MKFDLWFKLLGVANLIIAIMVFVGFGFIGCAMYKIATDGPPAIHIKIDK